MSFPSRRESRKKYMSKKKIFVILLTLVFGLVPFLVKANPPGPLPEDSNIGIQYILIVALVLCATTLIECLVSLLILKIKKHEVKKTRFTFSIIVANLISYPLFYFYFFRQVWFLLPFLVIVETKLTIFGDQFYDLLPFLLLFIGAELFVVLLESFISWLIMKRFLSFSKILFIVFINNLVTCILGFILFWVFSI